jgi:hypothetical protein
MDAQVTLTQTAEIFRLNEMVIRMDAELQDVRNKLHHRELGVEEALIRSPLTPILVFLVLISGVCTLTCTGTPQMACRGRRGSIWRACHIRAQPLARWCLGAVVLKCLSRLLLGMCANLSLIFLKIRVAECSKNATLISVSETPASDLHQDVSRNASTTRAKYSTGVKVTRTTITYERQDHHL